jgi:hypothetical protein
MENLKLQLRIIIDFISSLVYMTSLKSSITIFLRMYNCSSRISKDTEERPLAETSMVALADYLGR